jgi:hypothetical protein
MAEIIFERTCNYWIDAGIVGLYDTLNKPVPVSDEIGGWPEIIKKRAGVSTYLSPEHLKIEGEEEHIDLALSYALERIRITLYDVSTEKQISFPEKDGRVKQMSTLAGDVIASGKQAEYTYFRKEIIKTIGEKNIFLPLKEGKSKKASTCVFCFSPNEHKLVLKEATDVFTGQTSRSSPFVEGDSSNRCFHSYHEGSQKCWKCGYVTFFTPLLLFYRRIIIDRDKKDTYYMLPFIPGNLEATYALYRSLSGKRGLARALGADLTDKNYETSFSVMPKGIPSFTLSFYYDLWDRLLPKSAGKLLQASQNIGLLDKQGTVFQTVLFLRRDSGQKSFIMRETTIDRSAYFIKLFAYLKQQMDDAGNGQLFSGLHSLVKRATGKGNQLQRLSVIRAAQALTEGRNVYRFLLAILLSDLKEDTAWPYDVYQITSLFQKYDQWLFKKEDEAMANIVEQAKNEGWHLSQAFWNRSGWDDDEKKNLIKRYYYSIERSPSPVKFLEQVRHAYKKVEKELPKEMIFHKEDGSEDIKRFEVYRVYFLAGLLNGLINKGRQPQDIEAQKNVEEV